MTPILECLFAARSWRSVLFAVLLPNFVFGAEPFQPIERNPVTEPWRWKRVDAINIPNIRCMDEVEDGSMLFGGETGVIRYDGLGITQIPLPPDIREAISPNGVSTDVHEIVSLRTGTFIAHIESSLVAYERGTWRILIPEIGNFEVNSQLVTGDLSSWLSTPDGLWQISNDLSRVERIISSADSSKIDALCIDQQGDLWVAERGPLRNLTLIHMPVKNGVVSGSESWVTHTANMPIKDGSPSVLIADSKGILYYGNSAVSQGLISFDPKSKTWDSAGDLLEDNRIFSAITRQNGTLWVGGYHRIAQYDGSHISVHEAAISDAPKRPFIKMLEAQDGKLWVITRIGIVLFLELNEQRWKSYQSLIFQVNDAAGNNWFIHEDNSIIRHNTKQDTWTRYGSEDGLIASPEGIHTTRDGRIWVVGGHARNAALSIYWKDRWTLFRLPNFGKFIPPNAFIENSDGNIWVGVSGNSKGNEQMLGGAIHLKMTPSGSPEKVRHYAPNSFPKRVMFFAKSRDGTLWLGPQTQFFDKQRKRAIRDSNFPRGPSVKMETDAAGNLWIAKRHVGLFMQDGAEWIAHNAVSGLKDSYIIDFTALADGTLIAAGLEYFSRYDGHSWVQGALPPSLLSTTTEVRVKQSRDGSLWINQLKGLDPNQSAPHLSFAINYNFDRNAPTTQIDQAQEVVPWQGNTHISWSGIDPWEDSARDQLLYSYRLNDEAWSPFSPATGHTFVNLDSGDHTIEVRARDLDFNIDPNPAQFAFVVSLPAWQQPWFIAMIVLIIFGAIALVWQFIYFREKGLRQRAEALGEMNEQKNSFFTNVTHEIKTPLATANIPLVRMYEQETEPRKKKQLNIVMRNLERINTLMDQLRDIRTLENQEHGLQFETENISEVLKDAIQMLTPLAKAKNIDLRLEGPDHLEGSIDREALLKIMQNLSGNAIKFTDPGGDVRIQFGAHPDSNFGPSLTLQIEDNGRGIPKEDLAHIFERFYRVKEAKIVDGSGVGLHLAHQLVDLWGGTLQAESPVTEDPDRPGTRFTTTLPLTPKTSTL
ncbi:MAG: ATP-binding protein [Opitutales bacterium]